VNLDYHVEIAKHYYSVPYNLVHQEVEAWITLKTVEIFFPRQARGLALAQHVAASADDDSRAYAQLAPLLSRLVP
jgi:hypothetical protein